MIIFDKREDGREFIRKNYSEVAEHVENIESMLENAGFVNIRMVPKDNSKEIINSWVQTKT
ncbi:MAG: hypothetical protein ACOX2E_11335 [Syntrophaceticus sp.]